MTTYTQLRTLIIDNAENNDPEFLLHVDDFIRAAELEIFRKVDLRAFRVQVSSQLTTNSPYVTLPNQADVIVRIFHIKDTTNRRVLLLPKNYSFCRDYWPNQSITGQPRYYAHWRVGLLFIVPTPNLNYYAEIEYSGLPQSITANSPFDLPIGQNSWLGDNGWTALLSGSMVEAYKFMKGEDAEASPGTANSPMGRWVAAFQDALNDLASQESRERLDDFRAKGPQ